MREHLILLIEQVLKRYGKQEAIDVTTLKKISYEIEVPKNESFGDLSVNVAFKLSKMTKAPPLKIAEVLNALCEDILASDKSLGALIEKHTVAKPGFLNFTFSEKALSRILQKISQDKERYGLNKFGKGKKVLIEFVSANPTGPLTIAHGRQACVGDSLAAIMTQCGFSVSKEFYLNDGGRQIQLLGESVFVRYSEALGASLSFPEEGYQGEYISEIAKQLKEEVGDQYLEKDKENAVGFFASSASAVILDGMKEDLGAIAVSFDHFYLESTLYEEKNSKSFEGA